MNSLKKTVISLVGVSALSFSLAMPAMATYTVPTAGDCTSALASIGVTITSLVNSILGVPIAINAPIKFQDINLFNDADVVDIDNTLNNLNAQDLINLQYAFKNAKFLNLSDLSVITGNDALTKNGVLVTEVVSVYKSLDGIVVFYKKH